MRVHQYPDIRISKVFRWKLSNVYKSACRHSMALAGEGQKRRPVSRAIALFPAPGPSSSPSCRSPPRTPSSSPSCCSPPPAPLPHHHAVSYPVPRLPSHRSVPRPGPLFLTIMLFPAPGPLSCAFSPSPAPAPFRKQIAFAVHRWYNASIGNEGGRI